MTFPSTPRFNDDDRARTVTILRRNSMLGIRSFCTMELVAIEFCRKYCIYVRSFAQRGLAVARRIFAQDTSSGDVAT